MAQIELRFFDSNLESTVKNEISREVQGIVFREHYPGLVRSRRTVHGMRLQPGDITLVVPQLDTELSISDAQYEVEISEGSGNWPHITNEYPSENYGLAARARRISHGLAVAFGDVSHNIFEVNGQGTGWVQYKSGDKVE